MRQSRDTRPAERLERIMPDLPSGTVTFLFTDIEGSTERAGANGMTGTQGPAPLFARPGSVGQD